MAKDRETARRATRRRHIEVWILVVLAVAVGSCGTTEPDAGTVQTTTTVATTTPPTTTAPPTATTAPTTTTTTAPPEPLWLLAFGDSFAAAGGWPSQLGELASERLGTEVKVGGQICALGCSGLMRVFDQPAVGEAMAQADVIVVQPRPGRVFDAPFRLYLSDSCGGDDGRDCIRRSLEEFVGYMDELLDRVLELAGPDAVIRAVPAGVWAIDFFYPDVREQQPETFVMFVESMIEYIDIVKRASAERCILVTDASALFNGPDYLTRIDPVNTVDGGHPSAEGSRLIAEDLDSLGYEPTVGSC